MFVRYKYFNSLPTFAKFFPVIVQRLLRIKNAAKTR